MPKEILSIRDVADRFGLDYSTVQKAISRGELPCARREPSGDLYFLSDDLPTLARRLRREERDPVSP